MFTMSTKTHAAYCCLFACLISITISTPESETKAICRIEPEASRAEGEHNPHGTITFVQNGTELNVDVQLTGFKKFASEEGANDESVLFHGFHVHTYGDISGGCGTTGGHYNPLGVNHGGIDSDPRHIGDFGNIKQCAKSGSVDYQFTDQVASLVGEHSIVGRAMMVHEGKDDLGLVDNDGSRASGNAGNRLACCTIVWAK